ncbi:MAG: 1-phosphofructokinase, partial [Candidatus Marinimicrobia bacterium]|nr:1-phosphofructokinase [Candidatus Neomarinimicrobiota bacterium]
MPEIRTITLNTALDYLINLDELTPGGLHKSESAVLTPAGKGINVARTLVSLGESVYLTGFIGEENRDAFDYLGSASVRHEFIPVAGRTRINVTFHEKNFDRTTHIRNPGYSVNEQHIELLKNQLADTLSRGDYIILSGSLPPGAPDNLYAELIQLVHDGGGIAVLDSSGAALSEGISAQPDIIAPNATELSKLIDRELQTEQEIRDAAAEIA